MDTGLGDHHAAVGMTNQDDGLVEAVQGVPYTPGVTVEVGEDTGVGTVPGKVDGDGTDVARPQCRHPRVPAPGAVPSAVNEHHGVRHRAHSASGYADAARSL